jgi:hypothetical protein
MPSGHNARLARVDQPANRSDELKGQRARLPRAQQGAEIPAVS